MNAFSGRRVPASPSSWQAQGFNTQSELHGYALCAHG